MNNFSVILNRINNIHPSAEQQQRIGLITVTTLIFSYVLYKQVSKRLASVDNCPVIPYTDSLKGSTLEYLQDPRAFVEKWTEKLGHVYRMHFFGQMHTIVSGKYSREILVHEDFDFGVAIRKKFDILRMAGILDDSLTPQTVKYHIVKFLNPRLEEFTPRIIENFNIGFQEIVGDVSEPVKLPSIYPLIRRMIARASASIFIGETLCKNEKLVSLMQNLTTDIGDKHPRYNQPWLLMFPRLLKLYFRLYGRFSQDTKLKRMLLLDALIPEIDKRRAEAQNDPNWQRPDDILQELIEDSTLSSGKHGDYYTAILNQLILLIAASVHTTGQNGTIIFYRILQNPTLIDELVQEQEQVLLESGNDPKSKKSNSELFTASAIKKMAKLDSVCRESLRLRNQFLELPHTNIRNHKVTLSNGVDIPPDGEVLINTWYTHCQGGEDMSEFKPFRYVDTGYAASKVSNNYLVFGIGKHACPGRWLALQKTKTIISMIIRDFKIYAPEGVVFPAIGTDLPYGKVIIERK